MAGSGVFELAMGPDATGLGEMRTRLEQWLVNGSVREPVVSDLVIATTELSSNAVRAARTEVMVRAVRQGDHVIIEVVDDGPGITDDVPEREPDPLAEFGRGLYVVRQLVDVLWLSHDDETGGTRARCARRVS